MKRPLFAWLPLLVLVFSLSAPCMLSAQSKKELLAEVQSLRTELSETRTSLAQSSKEAAAANARVLAIETELTDLRQTNANLLSNLNRITEESSKKTASISESLSNIQRTERQLRTISDGLTRQDSTTLGILTAIKQTLGENAKIGVSNNTVTLAIENTLLFGADDKAYSLQEGATETLTKIADILSKYPGTQLQVEGHANAIDYGTGAPADNLELSALRAVAVARTLSSTMGVSEDRIIALGKGIEGLSLETTTHFKIQPDFAGFYKSLKDAIKN